MKTHISRIAAMRRYLHITIIAIITTFSVPSSAIELNFGVESGYVGRYGLYWWGTNAIGNNSAVSATVNHATWAPATTVSSGYYNPNRPTIIYFHGWQPGAVSDRNEEDFTYTFGTETKNTLEAWKHDGWNVGVFYWTPWADDSGEKLLVGSGAGGGEFASLVNFDVNAAEAKLWSSNGATGMRFKYYKPGTADKYLWKVVRNSSSVADKESYADSIKLKALQFSGSANVSGMNQNQLNGIKMHNATEMSQVKSAARFILNRSNYYDFNALVTLRENSATCKAFVEALACKTHSLTDAIYDVDTSKTCPTPIKTGFFEFKQHTPFWEEVFVPQVCEVPSVGVMAAEMIAGVLDGNQVNADILFAGHSLGNQAAVQTATRMWWKRVSGNIGRTALPKRLDLLDPYYSSQQKPFLKNYFPQVFQDSGHKHSMVRTTWGKAYSYVLSMNEMFQTEYATQDKLPVMYLDTSILSDFAPSGSPNTPLRDYAAYQKLNLNYLGNPVASAGQRHVDGRLYYFATKTDPARANYPPLNATLPHYPVGPLSIYTGVDKSLNADSPVSYIRKIMDLGGAMVMTQGADTFGLNDDAFTWTADRSNVTTLLKTYGTTHDSQLLSEAQEDILLVEGNRDEHNDSNTLMISADNQIEDLFINGNRVSDSLLPNRNDWMNADILQNLHLNPGLNVIAMKVYNAPGSPDGVFANLEFNRGARQSLNESAVGVHQYFPGWQNFEYDDSAWPHLLKRANYGSAPWNTEVAAIDDVDIDSAWSWSSGNPSQVGTVYIRWHVYVQDNGWKIKMFNVNGSPIDTDYVKNLFELLYQYDPDAIHTFTQETLDFTDGNIDTGNYLTGVKGFGIGEHKKTDKFGLVARTTITAPSDGWYTFGLKSDDGSVLKVNSQTVVSYDGYHAAAQSVVGATYLSAGVHQVEVVYFEGAHDASLEVFYATGNHDSFNATDFSLLKGTQVL